MFTYIVLGTLLLNVVYILEAARPKYREDYRYEQAFDSFYKLHQTAATWEEARIRCQAEGTNLLVPTSLDETDAVPLLVTIILSKFNGIFVGIHDLYSERFFVTIFGATITDSILNLLWEYKEPEHGQGRCMAMRRTGRIFVHPCDSPLPFVCKMEGKDIRYYDDCDTFDPRWKLGENDTCYITHKEPQTWYQAFGTCVSAGGHLAVVNNHSEADYIRGLFKNAETRRMPTNDFAFLGFNDLFQRHQYRTVHGERVEDLRYNDWEEHCPKTYNRTSKLRCGGMRRSGLLTVGDCDVPAMFFCEKHVNVTRNEYGLRQAETTVKHTIYHSPWNK